jgi:hypothetical protein
VEEETKGGKPPYKLHRMGERDVKIGYVEE